MKADSYIHPWLLSLYRGELISIVILVLHSNWTKPVIFLVPPTNSCLIRILHRVLNQKLASRNLILKNHNFLWKICH